VCRSLSIPVQIPSDEAHGPLGRLRRHFEALKRDFARAGWSGGCSLGMLGQELADRDAGARDTLSTIFGRWRHRIADCLREARDHGQLRPSVDCDELASFVLDGWEGALMQMKLRKSGAPIDTFLRVAFEQLLIRR